MHYFVPSWVSSNTTQPWQYLRKEIEFDDTVNQVKMFDQQDLATKLLILDYAPNLRSLLHRQDLLQIPYWSVFDELQGIDSHLSKTIQPFDFQKLNWPKTVQFIYSPFIVTALVDHEVYAKIYFNEAGLVLWIVMYEKGEIAAKYVFDDRGFLSGIDRYQSKQHTSTEYLNQQGNLQMTYDTQDQRYHIEPGSTASKLLNNATYTSVQELVMDRLTEKLSEVQHSDTVIIAASEINQNYFADIELSCKKVLTYFADRDLVQDTDMTKRSIASADLVVADSDSTMAMVTSIYTPKHQLTISPFDSRLNLGASQEIRELIIYLYIDLMSGDELRGTLDLLLKKIRNNKDIRVILGTYETNLDEIQRIDRIIASYNLLLNPEPTFQDEIKELNVEREIIEYFKIGVIREELDLITLFDRVRLIVDLGAVPDLYTQIAGISAGIPQVNVVESNYVKDQENGLIISGVDQLSSSIDYYFDQLMNWNRALIYAINRIAENNSGELIRQWQAYLEL